MALLRFGTLPNHMSIITRLSVSRPPSPRRAPFTSTRPTFLATKFSASMDQLEPLPSITRLSEHVVRVLGQNPGKFTLQGTNTYIIGKENPYTLVDTGEGRTEYIPVLESALRETAKSTHSDRSDVSDIIISHWHPDHMGGLPSVLSLLRQLWTERNPNLQFKPPRLHKFPRDPKDVADGSPGSDLLSSIMSSLPSGTFTPASFSDNPFHDLHDNQIITTSGLHVLHTPGHTSDSIGLYIPQDRALYTADTVLGQGTAVFEDLSLYISSLNKMLEFNKGDGYTSLYPGHGPVVVKGKQMISGYIKHRLEREEQIIQMLRKPPPTSSHSDSPLSPSKYWTTWSIVETMYSTYPESLWLPAARSVDLHLRKLLGDGVVRRVSGELQHTSWELVDILSSSPVDRKAERL